MIFGPRGHPGGHMGQVIALNEHRHPLADLLREADHRIANQLTVVIETIKAQLAQVRRGPDYLSRDTACSLLEDSAAKVLSIARLHRHLAQRPHGDTVDVGDLLIEVLREIVSSLSLDGKLRIAQRLSSGSIVSVEQAQTISLLVMEIVMNAIKHAHPTGVPVEIAIVCARTASGNILLELDDDGIGLPEGFDTARDGGLGFRLIRALAQKLDATLVIQSDTLGLSFRAQFLPPAMQRAASAEA